MKKPTDGGPAFPFNFNAFPGSTGMSLRDWLAGQALAGWLASMRDVDVSDVHMIVLAPFFYNWADSMLKAREVKP